MTTPMKLGNCLDRISGLPDNVLGHLLSFLPTRCAVRTSILSTRWRYLFTLTTSLSFDDAHCLDCLGRNEINEATQRFKDFVDKVLKVNRISPIKKFGLLCRGSYDHSDLSRWLSNALQRGVQELHYELFNQIYCLPHDFFVCETLVSLKITSFVISKIRIPIPTSLSKLKILHLHRINFVDINSMERLFSSCELLEDLTLEACECEDRSGYAIYSTTMLKVLTLKYCFFWSGTFGIDVPNLAYLTYVSNIGVKIVPSWKYSCSFRMAKLVFKCSAFDSVESDHELLKAAAYKTTELDFEVDSVKLLGTLDDDDQMPHFPNLSILDINVCPYDMWKYVTSLIDKSPQLETVSFGSAFRCCICSHHCYSDEVCYCDSPSPSDIPMDAFSCRAQVIEVESFCGHNGPLSLVGHLLRNASDLKKLVVHINIDLDLEEQLKICKNLLMLPRASKDCCIEMEYC